MRNKLIILSFALALGLTGFAQSSADSFDQDAKISIYPNPAVEYIIIELDDSFSNAKFELNSMIGNKIVIKPEEIGQRKFRISLKDYATGYYFLIVKDEETRFKKAFKFLVKN
ncbi:MAG: T9SS type A sorting domain-containing protein [Cyclobacteriaceae bacterium]